MLLQDIIYNDSYYYKFDLLRDCLYSLREQICMLVYRESEIIYFTHTENLKLLLLFQNNNNQFKRYYLDS